jgi:hypothetical protein
VAGKNPTVINESPLSAMERMQLAAIPTVSGKMQYMTQVKGYKPEQIVDFDGKAGVFDEKTNTFKPINPEGIDVGDIAAIAPKAAVTVGQVGGGALGGLAGGGIASLLTGAAGAGAGGAGVEALIEKLNTANIKKNSGVDIPVSGKEIAKEGIIGGVGEFGGSLVGRGISKLLSRGAAKPAAAAAGDMIDTAKILPTKLEHSTIQNITENPYVRENIKPLASANIEDVAADAAKSTLKAKGAIRDIQNQFYKNLGIKDDMPVDVNLAMAKVQHTIDEFSKGAIGSQNKATLKEAQTIYDDLSKETTNNAMSFGNIKQMTRALHDLSEQNVTDMGRHTEAGKLYSQMGAALGEAKNNIPAIKQAGSQYADLMDAEQKMNKLLRLNTARGEINLERKILATFKDKGNQEFKSQIEELGNIFKKYPESQPYAGFVDKIKLAQALNDISSKKAVTPQGIGRLPLMQYLSQGFKIADPEFQANLLKRGLNKGIINPAGVMGQTQRSSSLIGGNLSTRTRAVLDILNKPKISDLLPKPVTQAAPVAGKAGIMSLLRSQSGENQ